MEESYDIEGGAGEVKAPENVDTAPSGSGVAPRARRRPVRRTVHGVDLVDDYAWLADRGSPEALAYLEAENRYAEQALQHAEPLCRALYQEFVDRIKETDMTVPIRMDDFYYYSRTEKGCEYGIHCRRKGSLEAPEEMLLDLNELAEGTEFFRVGSIEVSPDHRLLAYCVDSTGGESYELGIRELESGDLLDTGRVGIAATFCWANDSRTLFYATLDAAKRPYRVWRHVLGATEQDVEVYREDDEAFFVSLRCTRSRGYVMISSASNVATEVRYIPADAPDRDPEVVEVRRPEIEYYVDHHGDFFLLRTNDQAKNFRLVERPVGGTHADDREILESRPDVKLEDFDVFADHIVLWEREGGLQRLRLRSLDGSEDRWVDLPESVYTLNFEPNPEFATSQYRFGYTSLITPATVFDLNLTSGELTTLKVQEVHGYERDRYSTSRISATAPDGTAVPVSLVHRRELDPDGSNPCLLQGYGAYGSVMDPVFSPISVSLLDRGFVLATAHVRGGGLMGEEWHEEGRMLAKGNSFSDFIAAAEALVDTGLAARDRLAIRGGSAGGLLVGAVINMRPDLFRAVVARVPFVDVMNTMLDKSIPLTVIEFEEWGNPEDPKYFDYMMSYSPYDNVMACDYPTMLVTAGLNDPRVQYWEPAKWVARLRALKTDDNVLILRTHMGAGHAGPSGRYSALEERALEYAFLLKALEVG